ncbi:MAG: guanosine monophosphate reductase [Nanoarchaeota archaeon]
MLTSTHEVISFDDILLYPQYNEIESRLDTDVSTLLTKNIKINSPIVAANMSSITGEEMVRAMDGNGIGILHRFMPQNRLFEILESLTQSGFTWPVVVSVGVKDSDYELVKSFKNYVEAVCIDIAHGDSKSVVDMVKHIQNTLQYVDIIVGNIATVEAAERFCKLEVDALKCGVGGGGYCETRKVTGHGVPTLQSVIDCSFIADQYNIPIIADGGFRSSGDIVKALACGASSVMLGSLLAGTEETPAEKILLENGLHKIHYGESSEFAMERRDIKREGISPEGIKKYIPCKGSVKEVVDNLIGGIRSGLTYSGARNIRELQSKARILKLSQASIRESKLDG